MNRIIGLLIGLMVLSGVSLASTQTYWATGTTTLGALVTITYPATVNSITIINDGTTEVYANMSGRAAVTVATITTEASTIVLAASQTLALTDFRTRRSILRAKSADCVYRIWATY
jgi:hypothetical protein